jgi:hypothetical protein
MSLVHRRGAGRWSSSCAASTIAVSISGQEAGVVLPFGCKANEDPEVTLALNPVGRLTPCPRRTVVRCQPASDNLGCCVPHQPQRARCSSNNVIPSSTKATTKRSPAARTSRGDAPAGSPRAGPSRPRLRASVARPGNCSEGPCSLPGDYLTGGSRLKPTASSGLRHASPGATRPRRPRRGTILSKGSVLRPIFRHSGSSGYARVLRNTIEGPTK